MKWSMRRPWRKPLSDSVVTKPGLVPGFAPGEEVYPSVAVDQTTYRLAPLLHFSEQGNRGSRRAWMHKGRESQEPEAAAAPTLSGRTPNTVDALPDT
jgi:hypothetical protein